MYTPQPRFSSENNIGFDVLKGRQEFRPFINNTLAVDVQDSEVGLFGEVKNGAIFTLMIWGAGTGATKGLAFTLV